LGGEEVEEKRVTKSAKKNPTLGRLLQRIGKRVERGQAEKKR